MRRRPLLVAFVLLCVTISLVAGAAFAQVNTATLSRIGGTAALFAIAFLIAAAAHQPARLGSGAASCFFCC